MKFEDVFLTSYNEYCNEDGTVFRKLSSKKKCSAIYGVGINDSVFVTSVFINEKQHIWAPYQMWRSMLKRGYDDNYKEKHPTYKNVGVCKDWHRLSVFWEWLKQQKYVENYQLDKDILGGKYYSPENCVIVPHFVNTFINDVGASRGNSLIGTSFREGRGKYQARVNNPFTKKCEHLGEFKDQEIAHAAWLERKLGLCFEMKSSLDEISPILYFKLVDIICKQQ